LARIWRQKLGRFFGAAFLGILSVKLIILYTKYLVATTPELDQVKGLADQILPNAANFQASLLDLATMLILWFQVAFISGALISRDTLYRIRPLIYAHPVSQMDYLASKALVAFAIPFCIQLPFILLPWLASMLIAGVNGPVWPITPLLLIPAAALNSMVMASVALGASAMASTPKAGMGWALGLFFAPSSIGGILSGIFREPSWMVLNPMVLTTAWPNIMCGVKKTGIPSFWPVIIATVVNLCLWMYVAKWRTRASEAVI
jgi:ABC-type transport system involved in multi-copper enzyme maturation permease subunit